MKIAVPVSHVDIHSLQKWIEVVNHLGGLELHGIVFIPELSVADQTRELASLVKCPSVDTVPLDHNPEGGWPMAPNYHFYRTVDIMTQYGQPWLWCELDAIPRRSSWINELAVAYSSCGAPFFGRVVPAPWRDDATGKIVPSPLGNDDTIMCGVGIYPANMGKLEHMGGLLLDFSKGTESSDAPFDVHLRFAIKANGVANTNLIEDRWSTQNYRIIDGVMVCDPKTDHPANVGKESRAKGGVISPNAALIHGCKDDSLANLILGIKQPQVSIPAQPQSTEQTVTVASESKKDDEIAALKSEMQQLKELLLAAVKPAQQKEPEQVTKKEEPINAIVKCIKSSPKKLRPNQVADATGLSEKEVRRLCSSKNSPVSIAKLGWMSLTT